MPRTRKNFYDDSFIGQTLVNSQGEEMTVIDKRSFVRNNGALVNEYLVRFKYTGTKLWFRKDHLLKSGCIDPYYPTSYDQFSIGMANTKYEGYRTTEYALWDSIVRRCYDPNNISYKHYGALGVTICEYWKCYENFLYSLPSVENYSLWYNEPWRFDLDKDYYQYNIPHNQRVYSPDKCVFLTKRQNSALRSVSRNVPGIRKNNLSDGTTSYTLILSDITFGTFTCFEAAMSMRNLVLYKIGDYEAMIEPTNPNYSLSFNEILRFVTSNKFTMRTEADLDRMVKPIIDRNKASKDKFVVNHDPMNKRIMCDYSKVSICNIVRGN